MYVCVFVLAYEINTAQRVKRFEDKRINNTTDSTNITSKLGGTANMYGSYICTCTTSADDVSRRRWWDFPPTKTLFGMNLMAVRVSRVQSVSLSRRPLLLFFPLYSPSETWPKTCLGSRESRFPSAYFRHCQII